jgi:hypothetical protein
MIRADDTTKEYQLKAAFLVNFSRFITWPEQAFPPDRQELHLCVIGANPYGAALHRLEGKKINGRGIRTIRLNSPKNSSQCHMLYVSSSEKDTLGSLLSGISQQPVVTVSDINGFVDAGGTIEFVTEASRLSFIINYSSLKQRGLQASASMLDLAASVR